MASLGGHVAEHGDQENSDGSKAGAETVKLDAAALRKLVVSTVLDLGEDEEQPAADGARPAGKPEPR
jgi:hypothetical protein